jgi:hypothetical protein
MSYNCAPGAEFERLLSESSSLFGQGGEKSSQVPKFVPGAQDSRRSENYGNRCPELVAVRISLRERMRTTNHSRRKVPPARHFGTGNTIAHRHPEIDP